jgi:hypothetical protein
VVWLAQCPSIPLAVAGFVARIASPPSLSLPRLLESFQKVPLSLGTSQSSVLSQKFVIKLLYELRGWIAYSPPETGGVAATSRKCCEATL